MAKRVSLILFMALILVVLISRFSFNPDYQSNSHPLAVVTIIQGDEQYSVLVPTLDTTVGDIAVFNSAGTQVQQIVNSNKSTLAADMVIANDMTLQIENSIAYYTIEKRELPYPTIRDYDTKNLTLGEARISEGKVGEAEQLLLNHYKDGVLIKETILVNKQITAPTAKTITIGRRYVYLDIDYSNAIALDVEATAYTDTMTATGIKPYKGVIAVDPRIIPYYSKVYVPGYGMTTALDTGGAIKGNIIDLFFEDRTEALRYGRQRITIYVLK